MSLIIPVGVFTRYVLGYGAQWPEPIAILLMVVFTFIGAAAAYRAGGHIAVAMLTDRAAGATAAHGGPVGRRADAGGVRLRRLVRHAAVPGDDGADRSPSCPGCRWA